MTMTFNGLDIEKYAGGDLPPRVYSKSGKPVLLATPKQVETLIMLLRASDKTPDKWRAGCNENGWYFCYASAETTLCPHCGRQSSNQKICGWCSLPIAGDSNFVLDPVKIVKAQESHSAVLAIFKAEGVV